MSYLDDTPKYKLFTPPHRERTDEERAQEWQNEGHNGITEDFSDMKTPQEVQDLKKINVSQEAYAVVDSDGNFIDIYTHQVSENSLILSSGEHVEKVWITRQ